MKNNVKNLQRIPEKILLPLIKLIGYFNHALYMRFYIPYLRRRGMDIKGTPVYIAVNVKFDGKDYSKIHIGDRSVVSSDVRFLTHDYSISRAIEAGGTRLEKEAYFLRDIYVGNNCFVGTRSILMPGCRLGNNVIVGAGSVVRGNVPDDTIVMGNPAVPCGNTVEWGKKKMTGDDLFYNAN